MFYSKNKFKKIQYFPSCTYFIFHLLFLHYPSPYFNHPQIFFFYFYYKKPQTRSTNISSHVVQSVRRKLSSSILFSRRKVYFLFFYSTKCVMYVCVEIRFLALCNNRLIVGRVTTTTTTTMTSKQLGKIDALLV